MSDADRYTLETPENIQVHFELAGLGTRFCAMLVDTLLLVAVIIVLLDLHGHHGLQRFARCSNPKAAANGLPL